MLQFFITNLVLISLGTMIYLTVRALPRIDEEPLDVPKHGFLDRWIASGVPEKIDTAFNAFLDKFLRKLKVLLLKIDNTISRRLQKIRTVKGKANTPLTHLDEMRGVNGNGANGSSKK